MKVLSIACAAMLFALGAAASQSRASVLAYDGFAYAQGSGIAGQAGGSGFLGSWQSINGSPPAPSITAGSETFTGNATDVAAATGNAAFITNNSRVGRLLDTSLAGPFAAAGLVDSNGNIGASGKTVWASFVLRQPSTSNQFFEFEFHRSDLGDPGRVAGIGNDAQNQHFNLRTGSINNQQVGALDTADHLFVMSFQFATGATTVSVYTDPTGSASPVSPTFTTTTNSNVSFNGISLAAFNGDQTFYADEIRFGTTYADVVGVVPEPVTGSVVLLTGTALLKRRRRVHASPCTRGEVGRGPRDTPINYRNV